MLEVLDKYSSSNQNKMSRNYYCTGTGSGYELHVHVPVNT